MQRRYEVIFFDAGGTLLYPYPSVGAVYAEVGERHGIHCSPSEIEQAFRVIWQEMQQEREGRALRYGANEAEAKGWWKQVVEAVFREVGVRQDLSAYFEEVYQVFARPQR